jgi:CHAD domain-containing protein
MAEAFNPSEILGKRLNALSDELAGVRNGDVEAIHRTRVATRRLREVLPIAVTDHQSAKDLGRRLRDVNRALGPVRELDVLAELIAELENERQSLGAALHAVGRAVKGARHKAGRRLGSAGRKLGKLATRVDDLVGELRSKCAADLRKTRREWRWAVQARVFHRARRLQSAMDQAGVLYASGPLHDVRVAIKKLRYAMELADEIGEAQPGAVKALKAAQDLLGRQHDLDVFIMWGRQVQASADKRASWGELVTLTRAIERDCRELHARYIRECPALTALIVRASANVAPAVDVRRAAG